MSCICNYSICQDHLCQDECYVFDDCQRVAKWLEEHINTDLDCFVTNQSVKVTGSTQEIFIAQNNILYITIQSPFTSNVELNSSSLSIVTTTTNGILSLIKMPPCGELVFKYVPNLNYSGTDSFVYWLYANPPYETQGAFSIINIIVV